MLNVIINGEARRLTAPVDLRTVVADYLGTDASKGVAVGHNRTVVPRAEWEHTPVAEGDEIEIVAARQGG